MRLRFYFTDTKKTAPEDEYFLAADGTVKHLVFNSFSGRDFMLDANGQNGEPEVKYEIIEGFCFNCLKFVGNGEFCSETCNDEYLEALAAQSRSELAEDI